MHWNNRVVRVDDGDTLKLAEVYYDEKNRPMGFAEVCTVGDTIEEMRVLTARLATAVEQCIVDKTLILDERTDFIGAPDADEPKEEQTSFLDGLVELGVVERR